MKSIFKRTIIRKWLIAGMVCLIWTTMTFDQCVFLDGDVVYDSTLTAGETATFTVNMYINAKQDNIGTNDRLVLAILVPKSWNVAANTTITYISSYYPGVVKTMSVIPASSAPKNQPGMTWADALKTHLGVGPNVVDEMEWVSFWSDDIYDVHNGDNQTAAITVKIKVGPDDMRVKLGFLLNTSDDGLSWDDNNKYYDYKYTDCIDVVNGNTATYIDFCERQLNSFTPFSATKNDITTVTFQGDVQANALDGASQIYLCAKAITNTLAEYAVTERTSKTQMINISPKIYSLTFWPASYFGIPDDEEIIRMDYYFSNGDGSLYVLQNSDSTPDDPDAWFSSFFTCN